MPPDSAFAAGASRRDGPALPAATAALKFLPWLALLAGTPLQAAEQWFLMARHGECAPIDSLKRKVPDLGPVADPQSFAALMRGNGHAVTLTQQVVPKGAAFEVVVPDRGLALLFVTADQCTTAGSR